MNGGKASKKIPHSNNFDYKSIAIWSATGFFLGDTTFYNDVKVLDPSCKFENGKVSGPDWKWHYSPRNISFNNTVDKFSEIFENLILKDIENKRMILPLSGGLDSRTLAAALVERKNINTISYEFKNGINETKYAKDIASLLKWKFYEFKIHQGYLWDNIEELALINQYQVEFTHSRQMAVIDKIKKYGDLLLTGHWGDVLFDSPKINDNASLEQQAYFVIKSIAKPGGIELASELWRYWELKGDFKDYLFIRIKELLEKIDINSPKSKIRAFKSLHWAPRWANPNINVFKNRIDISTPYYKDEICKFICSIPNRYLSDRKIQIEYIKRKSTALARVPWQSYDLNLYQYKYFNTIYFPRRIFRFCKRLIKEGIFNVPPIIERNWELQFLGEKNDLHLKNWLFKTSELNNFVPNSIIKKFYDNFKNKNSLKYSHPVSMLLTLALWCKNMGTKK